MIRCLVLVVAFGVYCVSASAGTIHVPTDAPTIQIAIEKAQASDRIIVAPGTYFEAINSEGKAIILQSENPNDPAIVASTIINALGLGAVVTFPGGAGTVLDGFTITGGTIGVAGYGSIGTIRHCTIRDNTSSGVDSFNGAIERCVITHNSAGLSGCNGSLTDSIVERNRGDGVASGTVSILRSRITDNSGSGASGHNGRISQSLITGNSYYGGLYGGAGLIENSVIAGNPHGFFWSSKTVLSCTVTGNRGHGFVNHSGTIRHVILWNNILGNLDSSPTPVFSGTVNPLFVQPGFWDGQHNEWVDGDYRLSPTSPYIDAGDPHYNDDPNTPTLDLYGNPRVTGIRIDIGATEFTTACGGPDFDGDGISDACDNDIDNDGIPNAQDQCNDTPPGVLVDDNGRPLGDANHDCKVDLRDYAILQRNMFGP